MKIAQIMQKALNQEQRARVLPAFAANPRGLLAIGITEPDRSSDYLVPCPATFEAGVEKLVRDAAAFLHSDDANRTLLLKAANFMFGC